LSGYFLKHATTASYLDPRPSHVEIIEAIHYHYPIGVQRAMLTTQLRTIEDMLDLLRRAEVMETSEGFQRPHFQTQQQQQQQQQHPHSARHNLQSGNNDRRAQTQNHMRQIQYSPHRNRNNGNRWCNQNQHDRARDNNSTAPAQLNPNTLSFQESREQEQHLEN
jgi:hypothetical protein